MPKTSSPACTAMLLLFWAMGCDPAPDDEGDRLRDAGGMVVSPDGESDGDVGGNMLTDAGAASGNGAKPRDGAAAGDAGGASVIDGAPGHSDASAVGGGDGGAPPDRGDGSTMDAGDAAVPDQHDAQTIDDAGGQNCPLPATFKWSGGGPLMQPKNGWVSMKDVTHVVHNGQHLLYYTTFQSNWGSGMTQFKDWPDAATAPQTATSFGVAPTLFYFTPKNVWILAYQWGPHKFSYRTSSDPSNPSGWSAEKSLYNTALPPNGTGPIDQTVICDRARCYLYYAGDNGHIYKSSMPIGSFPGEFPAAQDSGIVGTAQNLFEAVQVYSLQGLDKYLMIVEAQGAARYFRAFTATSLEGPWTLLSNEFAIKKNVTLSANWTNDISHGDLVRSSADETFMVDPCHLQLVFQGRDPALNTDYGRLPYRLGLITLAR